MFSPSIHFYSCKKDLGKEKKRRGKTKKAFVFTHEQNIIQSNSDIYKSLFINQQEPEKNCPMGGMCPGPLQSRASIDLAVLSSTALLETLSEQSQVGRYYFTKKICK